MSKGGLLWPGEAWHGLARLGTRSSTGSTLAALELLLVTHAEQLVGGLHYVIAITLCNIANIHRKHSSQTLIANINRKH